MKKKILSILIALSLVAGWSIARTGPSATPKNRTEDLLLNEESPRGASLRERIDKAFGSDYGQIKRLAVESGELSPEDCRFIRESLPNLEELLVVKCANFRNGLIPKGAFEGHKLLKRIRAERATGIGAKAFCLCEGLEEADFPNVRQVGVQAFAQAKGSSAGQLRTVRLPKLEQMDPRTFYYCTNLTDLYLSAPPAPQRPVGKEGLWFERVTKMVIHVPSRKIYEEFVDVKNCSAIDWSAYNFVADNGDRLPEIQLADEYDDSAYDYLREKLLPVFDRTDKDYSGKYYTGDFKVSLNLYTFNMNLNAWLNNSSATPQLSTLDAIRWAARAGFDAVDVTCYYIPGYSNTAMPTRPEREILAYARQIRKLCDSLGLEISGTGLQNNFADPNQLRRETDVERIKFWIKVAAEMGAPVIRIFAGPPPADIRREGWEKIARERMAPLIREVAQYAKANYPKVRIGLQNHGCMLATANQVIQMLQWVDCDNVGIINDTGFYRDFMSTDATHYDWYRDIALVLPYSNNFQIKKKPAGAETRELMDLPRLLRIIRQSPYRGYLPIELLWVSKDEGYPGKLETPPYDETLQFLKRLKEVIEQTKTPSAESTGKTTIGIRAMADERFLKVLQIDNGQLTLLENVVPAQLAEQLQLPAGATIRVTAANGMPRGDLEQIADGDRMVVTCNGKSNAYAIELKHYELTNLALNPDPERIKKSSFQGKSPVTNAFDGNSAGNSGTGYQVDGSQASTPGKETFWLALDLGTEQRIDAFGIAWGTSVGNLKKRLRDGIYRVAYTNDPAKWEALSNARTSGRAGLNGYAAPKGWETAYEQDANDLPDANGNKFFIKELDKPVSARYVMVTGEMANSSVEIYNFFVFKQQLLDGATPQPVYPTCDPVRIRPQYDGMTLAPGRPALVSSGGPAPVFCLTAQEPIRISGRLVAPDGQSLYESEPVSLEKGAFYRMDPAVRIPATGTYRMEFRLDGETPLYDAYSFTAIDEEIAHYTYDSPYPALQLVDGHLNYIPDYRGNRVPDYSNAGYKGGGIAIENVPVRIVLEPSADSNSDDTERIQRAVEMLGRTPVEADGFRGAILLKAGTYRISRPILIAQDGIVIKGEGDGHESIEKFEKPLSPDNWFDYAHSEKPEKRVTKIVATWVSDSYNKNTALFNISGGKIRTEDEIAITDLYVAVGSRTLHLADVSGFKPGDNVLIHRAVNAAWAQDLKMDVITEAPGLLSANQWARNGQVERAYTEVCQERTIASVDPKAGTVTLVEPIIDPLDRKYGISTVARFSAEERVSQVGIENLQFISRFSKKGTALNTAFGVDYKFFDDECHAQVGVRIGNAENIWVRRITTYHIDVAVSVSEGVRWATIQDVNCLEPVSGTGGERRYSFTNSGGTLILNQRNYARFTRHGFIVMGNVMGPNVFYNDRTDYQFDANEPHLRWSAGGLYDNVQGRIYVQNRWNNGTAHGWSGANYTLYNHRGKFIISQNPLAANYLFGQSDPADRLPFVMAEVDPGNVPNYKAYEYSLGRPVTPQSLYLQQLQDRLGAEAVERTNDDTIPPFRDESAGFYERFAYLSQITVNGKPLPGFNREVLEYTVPIELDYTSLPKIVARGESGVKVTRRNSDTEVTLVCSKRGLITSTYTLHYGFISKEPVSGDGSREQLQHLTDGDPHTQWSQSGSPHVQFYLGDKPVEIREVSLGYCRNTQSRRQYYFDFEISNDGYHWTRVENEAWRGDNLGRGHLMGMQLTPGVGNSASDYETFVFPAGTRARLLRISMFGARFGRGSGTTNANAYWAIDVKTAE